MTPDEIEAFNQKLGKEMKSWWDRYKDDPKCKELFPEHWEEKERMNPENQTFVKMKDLDELVEEHDKAMEDCIDRLLSC